MAPPLIRAYTAIRSALSFEKTHTIVYAESVGIWAVASLAVVGLTVYTTLLTTGSAAILLAGSLLASLVHPTVLLGFTDRDHWDDEHAYLHSGLLPTIASALGVVAVAAAIAALTPSTAKAPPEAAVTGVIGLGNTARLAHAARKYDDIAFPIVSTSAHEPTWERASAYFTVGERHLIEDNSFRAHYWLHEAQDCYDRLRDSETRESFSAAAEHYSMAVDALLDAVGEPRQSRDVYFETSRGHIEAGTDSLNHRVCDSCYDVFDTEETLHSIEDGQVASVYCRDCHDKRKARSREQQTGTRRDSSKRTSTTRSRSTSRGRSSTQSAGRGTTGTSSDGGDDTRTGSGTTSTREDGDRSSVESSTGMSVSEAKDVLELSEPFSVADVNAAFREKSKQSHPDKGGDTSAMARLNKARSTLKQHAKSS